MLKTDYAPQEVSRAPTYTRRTNEDEYSDEDKAWMEEALAKEK